MELGFKNGLARGYKLLVAANSCPCCFLTFYVHGTWRMRLPKSLILATCLVLVGLQLLTLSSCISY
jgi:hypothetical protein